MAARLTFGLAAIALLVFAAVGFLLQWTLARELRRVEHQEIEGKADVVRHFLDEARDERNAAALRHHLDDVLLGNTQMRIWLLSNDGKVLYGGKRPPAMRAVPGGEWIITREDGVPLTGRRWAVSGEDFFPASQLVVAFDTRGRERLMRSYRQAIALVCGLALAVVVGLAAWIARRELRPVRRLAQEVSAIAPRALSTRLTGGNVVVELSAFVHAFNRALDRVEAAYAQLEAFNADVAHELRTPLATLISGTEVALQRPRSSEELQQTLAANLEGLQQMSAMVNDMLFLARADRGGAVGELAEVDLREQAQQVADYFDATLEERRQRLVLDGHASVPTGNAALIRRALANLVSNASRYTPPGKTIRLSVAPLTNAARVTVSNPGAPIEPALLPRLFERFVRGDAARTGSAEHHGLGLAIVRAIARMHGGEPFARSSDGITEIGFTLQADGLAELPGFARADTLNRPEASGGIRASP